MKRLDKFVISKRPYAIDPATFHVASHPPLPDGREDWRASVTAAWFRRRSSVPVACIGRLAYSSGSVLCGYATDRPTGPVEFVEQFTDGRYGGDCHARWDGVNLWAPVIPFEEAQAALAVLRPMLDAYPKVPDGFVGWWCF